MSTHDREQYKNAKILGDAGLGIILNQRDLSLKNLFSKIKDLQKGSKKSLALPLNATDVLATDLLSDFD